MWRKRRNLGQRLEHNMKSLYEILLRKRFNAYRSLFKGENGRLTNDAETVLADLKKFCRADRSTHVVGDPYASALAEGRREVFLRLCSFLHLSEKDFFPLTEDIDYDGASSTRTASGTEFGEFD
jgi:hypothetical protein